MNRVRVLYFAQAREGRGLSEEVISIPDSAGVAELLNRIYNSSPKLAKMGRTIRVSVNKELVENRASLDDGDEVALLPPVVGG
jgi:molybdopterin synthase sulfur carrier subunit